MLNISEIKLMTNHSRSTFQAHPFQRLSRAFSRINIFYLVIIIYIISVYFFYSLHLGQVIHLDGPQIVSLAEVDVWLTNKNVPGENVFQKIFNWNNSREGLYCGPHFELYQGKLVVFPQFAPYPLKPKL